MYFYDIMMGEFSQIQKRLMVINGFEWKNLKKM
jgi:hypothetical protein